MLQLCYLKEAINITTITKEWGILRKLITINRQFASGGREIGKRLADELKIAYYDKELIAKVVSETGFSADYIARFEETAASRIFPFTFGKTMTLGYDMPQSTVQVAQTKIIKFLGTNQDCVIVGRCANHILKEHAFKVLIYSSDMEQRIQRCYDKVPEDKVKTKEEIKKNILAIDKIRARYYEYYTSTNWLSFKNYNLCIDTAKISVKQSVKMIAGLWEFNN